MIRQVGLTPPALSPVVLSPAARSFAITPSLPPAKSKSMAGMPAFAANAHDTHSVAGAGVRGALPVRPRERGDERVLRRRRGGSTPGPWRRDLRTRREAGRSRPTRSSGLRTPTSCSRRSTARDSGPREATPSLATVVRAAGRVDLHHGGGEHDRGGGSAGRRACVRDGPGGTPDHVGREWHDDPLRRSRELPGAPRIAHA